MNTVQWGSEMDGMYRRATDEAAQAVCDLLVDKEVGTIVRIGSKLYMLVTKDTTIVGTKFVVQSLEDDSVKCIQKGVPYRLYVQFIREYNIDGMTQHTISNYIHMLCESFMDVIITSKLKWILLPCINTKLKVIRKVDEKDRTTVHFKMCPIIDEVIVQATKPDAPAPYLPFYS